MWHVNTLLNPFPKPWKELCKEKTLPYLTFSIPYFSPSTPESTLSHVWNAHPVSHTWKSTRHTEVNHGLKEVSLLRWKGKKFPSYIIVKKLYN